MPPRPVDEVTIESVAGADISVVIDQATNFEITNDLFAPSMALFEMGDDASWAQAIGALAIGARFEVRVNGRLRLTGRALAKSMPVSPEAGSTIRLTIRTALADAAFASASPHISVRRTSLRDAILAAYEPLGFSEADFIFDANVAMDLMTGRGGGPRTVDVEPLKEDAAKVHPPETIYAFAERHLNRFYLTHWDAPDGRIVVGWPDATQAPIYRLTCLKGEASRANNVLRAERMADYEQVPSMLGVFGVGGGKEYSRAKVSAVHRVQALQGIYRPVILIDEAIKTQDQAASRALREVIMRSRTADTWKATLDGLSFWDGSSATPWAVDAVADVLFATADAEAAGPYLIHRVTMSGDPDEGHITRIEASSATVWGD